MIRTVQAMGTLVTIQVIAPDDDRAAGAPDAGRAVERAFGWFREVEACCTRFDPGSEAMRLAGRIGVPVPASGILFEAVQFAVAVAGSTAGRVRSDRRRQDGGSRLQSRASHRADRPHDAGATGRGQLP